MSKQPEVGDTVYIVGIVNKVVHWTRPAIIVVTEKDDKTDSFTIYADQIALVESPKCAD